MRINSISIFQNHSQAKTSANRSFGARIGLHNTVIPYLKAQGTYMAFAKGESAAQNWATATWANIQKIGELDYFCRKIVFISPGNPNREVAADKRLRFAAGKEPSGVTRPQPAVHDSGISEDGRSRMVFAGGCQQPAAGNQNLAVNLRTLELAAANKIVTHHIINNHPHHGANT